MYPVKAERTAPVRMQRVPTMKPFSKNAYGIVSVPAPKQQTIRAKVDEPREPSRIVVLTKRPGEPTTLRMRLPGDIGGVAGAVTYS